jgi:hypothetical protein
VGIVGYPVKFHTPQMFLFYKCHSILLLEHTTRLLNDRVKFLTDKKNYQVYGRKNRIQYSGPLMPPGGNIEDMLKEHERLVQHAVRMARTDKDRLIKNY